MKNKKYLLFLFSLFVIAFCFSSALAFNSESWREYSPELTYVTNTQSDSLSFINSSSAENHVLFSASDNFHTFETPLMFPQQPTSIQANNFEYNILTDGQNLTIYNNQLTALNVTNSGKQIYTLSLFSRNTSIDIFGIFQNGSGTYFDYYNYDVLTNGLNLNTSANIPLFVSNPRPSAIKCLGSGIVYFNYNGRVCLFYVQNNLLSTNISTFFDNGTLSEVPLASNKASSSDSLLIPSMLDALNNGHLQILGSMGTSLYLHYANGSVIFNNANPAGYVYSDASFLKVTPTTYKIVYTLKKVGANDEFKIGFFNLDGSNYGGGSATVETGVLNSIKTGTIAIVDIDGNGIDEVALAYSNNTGTNVKVYDSGKNIVESGHLNNVIVFNSASQTYLQGQMIAARLNGNINHYNYMLSPLNVTNASAYTYIMDIENNVSVFSKSGIYVPVDINTDGIGELIGYNRTSLISISSSYSNQNAIVQNIIANPTSPAVGSSVLYTINATDAENDVLFYYFNCGNGNISAESSSNTFSCYYNASGSYSPIGYVRDQFHGSFNSKTITINVGSLANVNSNNTQVAGFVNSLLSIFPEANTLSFSQKIGITLVVMLMTAVVILLAGAQFGHNGLNTAVLWLTVILIVMEYIFFTALGYLPIAWLVILILASLALSYLRLRSGGK